jgi:hypothetical protein
MSSLGAWAHVSSEEIFKIIFQGILCLENIFRIFVKREKIARKILACKKSVGKNQICSGKNQVM